MKCASRGTKFAPLQLCANLESYCLLPLESYCLLPLVL